MKSPIHAFHRNIKDWRVALLKNIEINMDGEKGNQRHILDLETLLRRHIFELTFRMLRRNCCSLFRDMG